MRGIKNKIAKELRENAGIIASEKSGQKIRNALCNSLIDLATLIEDEEIPLKRSMYSCYLKGAFMGTVILQIVIVILLAVNKLL